MLKPYGKIPILVTAVGAELSFAVIKAIQCSQLNYNLIGCDIYKDVVGKYWCDQFENVPPAKNEDEYIQKIVEIVKKNKVEILIPIADIEFFVLSKLKQEFKEKYGCHILVNSDQEIQRFSDKWQAFEWYKKNEIPTPETVLCHKIEDIKKSIHGWSFPCIIKPRTGGGSRHIYTCYSKNDIEIFLPVVPEPIIQQYIDPIRNEEFTAGTYRTADNKVHVIVLRRTLKFGMTNTAETIGNQELEAFCKDVILKTNLIGSNNIQFRNGKEGPKVIEINPRFSGTTGIRANFGFNDVEMWITEALNLGKVNPPKIKKGKVLRYMDELYV
ncbi:MAG: hypothetical protein COA57_01040 [Flavobacteriales bacterium]|nr:MAG: hypothetical protein COA57_01040 [Flavobacteriales bacterium]